MGFPGPFEAEEVAMYISAPANRAGVSYMPIDQFPFVVPGQRSFSGLGLELDPMSLGLGVGALVVAFYFLGFGTRPKFEAPKRKRRQVQIGKLREQVQRLERAE
jgi:hypothetical protein